MVPALPAPRRAAGGEEVAAQVEQKMAGDFCEVLWGARFVPLVFFYKWLIEPFFNKSVGKSKGTS